jgi:hypothetical protein
LGSLEKNALPVANGIVDDAGRVAQLRCDPTRQRPELFDDRIRRRNVPAERA